MLYYTIATVHVLVCIILVLVVLLQSGKGADLAGAFGGGATQTAFGSRGPASFLSRMTTIAAIVFILTSIGLTALSTRKESKSILETTGTKASEPAKKTSDTPSKNTYKTQEQIRQEMEEIQKRNQQKAAPATKPEESKKPAK
jgi:preprotein translocase subunit SecG